MSVKTLSISDGRAIRWAILLLALTVWVSGGAYRKSWQYRQHLHSTLVVAHHLDRFHTFGLEASRDNTGALPGRQLPPAYPAILAAIAKVDPQVSRGLECYGRRGTKCTLPAPFGSLILVQIAAGVGIFIFVYLLAVELTGWRVMGYLSLVAYALLSRAGEYARFMQSDNIKHLLLFASFYLAAIGYRKNSVAALACSGALLGTASLFHPYFAYLLVLVPVAMMAITRKSGAGHDRTSWRAAGQLCFAMSGLVVLLPWAIRNSVYFGDPMLTDIYETRHLAMRIAFNSMPVSEYFVAVVNWIPTNGNDVAKFLFGETARVQQRGTGPGTYFHSGVELLTLAASAMPERNPVFYLLTEKVSPWSHLAFTPVIFTRGMWGSHGFMAYIGMALLPRLASQVLASPRRETGLALFVTAMLLTLVHALLTPNQYLLNAPMLLLMTLAVSHPLATLHRRQPKLAGYVIGGGIFLWAAIFFARAAYKGQL